MRLHAVTALFAAACVLTGASSASAEGWSIDKEASSVGFIYTENEERRTGRFGMINPQLRLDPDDLGQTRGVLNVSTGSLDLGDSLREGILVTQPWLDTGNYPNAVFAVERVVAGDRADRATVIGSLSIKGVSRPLSVPITIVREDAQVKAVGELRFDRLDYGLKDVVIESFVSIGEEIVLDFVLVAQRRS
jgi:polyisoprenoid-binding protein YceI